jgi:hypothetical protein
MRSPDPLGAVASGGKNITTMAMMMMMKIMMIR